MRSGRKAILLAPGLVLALVLVTLPFSGCPTEGNGENGDPPCLNDGDCGLDELCNDVDGKCFPGNCRVDRDCEQGSACEDNWCTGTCSSDADCQEGGAKPEAVCYRRTCYGTEESCETSEDCDQPTDKATWVTCNDFSGKCVPVIPVCTRDDMDVVCPVGMVCKADDGTCEQGVCVDQPAQCMSICDCPRGEMCNIDTATCVSDTSCEEGKRPDPVDGICRRATCADSRDCNNGEWCDSFDYPGCRKECASDNDCMKSEGEECQPDKTCRMATLCEYDQNCESCGCKAGLVCAVDHRFGEKRCRYACDIFDNDCDQGELCQPVLDGGTYPRTGGACQAPNQGGDVSDACDQNNYCEANLLCQGMICRAICNPGGEPGCDAEVDCTPYLGIGVCGEVGGCSSDLECNFPDEICWNQEDCQPGCHMPGTPVNCDGAHPCDPATGRCQGAGECASDADCDPPNTICDTESVPPRCTPSCLSVGCPGTKKCDPTTGYCKEKCLGDDSCNPPETICEHDVCILGCGQPGGLDCGVNDCIEATGRCGMINHCETDDDCNPPMTKCDEPWEMCVDGCGLTGCDTAQGFQCENTTGECVYSPCDYIGCACTTAADCQPDLICGFFTKKCTKSCQSDADCAPFYCGTLGYCE